jgi:hypothetical protein
MHAPVTGLQQPLFGQPLIKSGPDEQQGSPVPPHAVHVPADEQVRFIPLHGPLNRFAPKQQGSPAPPHWVHVPLKHARVLPISPPFPLWQGLGPTQQGSPLPPQRAHTPALQAMVVLVPRRPAQKSVLVPLPFAFPGQHAPPITPHPTIPPSAQYPTPPLGELVGVA